MADVTLDPVTTLAAASSGGLTSALASGGLDLLGSLVQHQWASSAADHQMDFLYYLFSFYSFGYC